MVHSKPLGVLWVELQMTSLLYWRLALWRHHCHRYDVKCYRYDVKGKGSPYSIAELISVLGSQPAGDVSHKPSRRLPLLSFRPAVTLTTLRRAAISFAAWWTEARWVWTVCLRHVCVCVWLDQAKSVRRYSRLSCRWIMTSCGLRSVIALLLAVLRTSVLTACWPLYEIKKILFSIFTF